MTNAEPIIRMVFTDVDGTLVGTSGIIPERVWDAARALRENGTRLALCSGRLALGTCPDYAKRLEPDGFHAFQNGASILQLKTGESQSRPLARATLDRLIARSRQTHQFLELYGDQELAFEGDERLAREHARLLGIPFTRHTFASLLDEHPIVRAQWLVPHAEAAALGDALTREFSELESTSSTSPLMPEIAFVMVTARGVNKASAVESIAAQAGIPLEQVMFVGDGDNDVAPMLRVGFPVAVANASPRAAAAARHHVPSVEAGGIAEAFALAMPGARR